VKSGVPTNQKNVRAAESGMAKRSAEKGKKDKDHLAKKFKDAKAFIARFEKHALRDAIPILELLKEMKKRGRIVECSKTTQGPWKWPRYTSIVREPNT
jgi:hypothetical protein